MVWGCTMSIARYKILLYNPQGQQVAEFDHWRSLIVERKLNDVSTSTIYLPRRGDSRIDLFTLDSIIEVQRKIEGGTWTREYIGFHRTPHDEVSETDRETFVSYSVGLNDLLKRRTIMYYATSAYTLKGGPGETCIKSYVNENAGPAATKPPRFHSGVTTGLTIEADGGRGIAWFGQRSYRNLLEVVQELALATSVDFDIVYTGVPLAPTFDFRCYYPHLGADRSATMKFSLEMGNMIIPSYSVARTQEGNLAVVMGQGEGLARRTLVVTRTAMNDSPWNQCEVAVDARQEDTYQGMLSAGDAELERTKAQESFNFRILQSEAAKYGRDYFLGDLITASFRNITRVKKISAVKLNVSEGKEDIAIEFGDYPPTT